MGELGHNFRRKEITYYCRLAASEYPHSVRRNLHLRSVKHGQLPAVSFRKTE